jgi:hypothetical protein
VSITLQVDTVLYTGRHKDAVKKEKYERPVKAGAGEFPLHDWSLQKAGIKLTTLIYIFLVMYL